MTNSIAAYVRLRNEANQPDPDDFETEEEYQEASEEYWAKCDEEEAEYFEGLADMARDFG